MLSSFLSTQQANGVSASHNVNAGAPPLAKGALLAPNIGGTGPSEARPSGTQLGGAGLNGASQGLASSANLTLGLATGSASLKAALTSSTAVSAKPTQTLAQASGSHGSQSPGTPGSTPSIGSSIASASTPKAALAAAVQEAVPRQDSLSGLFQAAQIAVEAAGRGEVKLPANVEAAAKQILGLRLPSAALNAGSLKAAIQNSGTFSESRLLTGQQSLTNPQMPNLAQPLVGTLQPAPLPAIDTKSAVLLLRNVLTAWLGTSEDLQDPRSDRPAPPQRGGAPQAQAQVQAIARMGLSATLTSEQLGRTLQQQSDQALSRIRLSQVASLPDAGDDTQMARGGQPSQTWTFEIPLGIGRETRIVQMDLEREAERPDAAHEERQTVIRFALDLGAAGPIQAHISHFAGRIGVRVWAIHEATAQHISRYQGELSAALGSHGLTVEELKITAGGPQSSDHSSARPTDIQA